MWKKSFYRWFWFESCRLPRFYRRWGWRCCAAIKNRFFSWLWFRSGWRCFIPWCWTLFCYEIWFCCDLPWSWRPCTLKWLKFLIKARNDCWKFKLTSWDTSRSTQFIWRIVESFKWAFCCRHSRRWWRSCCDCWFIFQWSLWLSNH